MLDIDEIEESIPACFREMFKDKIYEYAKGVSLKDHVEGFDDKDPNEYVDYDSEDYPYLNKKAPSFRWGMNYLI